eukprot:gene9412-15093_t
MTSIVVWVGAPVWAANMKDVSVNLYGGVDCVASLGNIVINSSAASFHTGSVVAPAASTNFPPPVVWFVPTTELNRRMHALNGNTTMSGKQARDAICSHLVRKGIGFADAQTCYDKIRSALRNDSGGEEKIARIARQKEAACFNSMQHLCREHRIEFPFQGGKGYSKSAKPAPKPSKPAPKRPPPIPSTIALRAEDWDAPVLSDVSALTRDTAAGVVLASRAQALRAATELRDCDGRIALVTLAPIVTDDGTALPHASLRVPINRVFTESGESRLDGTRLECLTNIGSGVV